MNASVGVTNTKDMGIVMADNEDNHYGSLFSDPLEEPTMNMSDYCGMPDTKGNVGLQEWCKELEHEVVNLQRVADEVQNKYLQMKTIYLVLKKHQRGEREVED